MLQYVLRLYNRKDWHHMWLRDPDTNKKIFVYPDLPGTNAGFIDVRLSAFLSLEHIMVVLIFSCLVGSSIRCSCLHMWNALTFPLLLSAGSRSKPGAARHRSAADVDRAEAGLELHVAVQGPGLPLQQGLLPGWQSALQQSPLSPVQRL